MTVDQTPLPFTAVRPLPPPWPPAGDDQELLDAIAQPANRPRGDEPPSGPGGWPRIFPGL